MEDKKIEHRVRKALNELLMESILKSNTLLNKLQSKIDSLEARISTLENKG